MCQNDAVELASSTLGRMDRVCVTAESSAFRAIQTPLESQMNNFVKRYALVSCWYVISVFLLHGSVFAQSESDSTDWAQWRGPSRDGKVDAAPWPDTLSKDRFIQNWRTALGPSYSGPLVVGDSVYITETVNEKDEVVRCLDRNTAAQKWEVNWTGSMKVPFFASSNGSWIRSTPACADGKLYVGGIRDMLVCIDASTGKILWQKDFPTINNTPIPMFGCVCSPLVDGDAVYMQAGGAMHKLNKDTGAPIWQSASDGPGNNSSVFSSPVIESIAGERQMLIQGRDNLLGVDLHTGRVLWNQPTPAFRGMSIVTPTVFNDMLFISNYQHPTTMVSIRKTSQQSYQLSEKWKNKARGYMTTPVIIEGHAYTFLQNQRFACVELETGAIKWSSEKFAKYASLIANGNRILALTADGDLILYAANPERFEMIDRRNVAADSWAHLAVSGNEVFVRTIDGLLSFSWQ